MFRLYNTDINNYAAEKLGLADHGIGCEEMMIFDFIQKTILSARCVKITDTHGTYYWISHNLIIDGLYLLKTKKWSLIKKIDKLIEVGLLERHPDCKAINKTYYRPGKLFDSYFFYKETKKDNAQSE